MTYPPPPPQSPHTTPADPPGTVGALVWSIVGVTVLPIIGSIVAIVMGGNARDRAAAMGRPEPGLARAGRIIGWVGLLLVAAPILVIIAVVVLAVLLGVL